jgi:predicted O-methyltransferase YrrM
MAGIDRLVRALTKKTFPLFERMGVHVTPVHYYGPVPDTRELRPELWSRTSELVGVDLAEDRQLQLLADFRVRFKTECDALPLDGTGNPGDFYCRNDTFGWVDAAILYCVLRYFKPHSIYEIGSGFSTLLTARAVAANRAESPRYECNVVTIDPFVSDALKAALPGNVRFREEPVQSVPLAEFEKLRAGDVLFIDSSHVLKTGSDVQWMYLEILPRLAPGVLIHAHDIFLPREYPERWIKEERRFWNEQYILQAFLSFNSAFEVLLSPALLHLRHPEVLAQSFAIYHPSHESPGSFWFRRRLDE